MNGRALSHERCTQCHHAHTVDGPDVPTVLWQSDISSGSTYGLACILESLDLSLGREAEHDIRTPVRWWRRKNSVSRTVLSIVLRLKYEIARCSIPRPASIVIPGSQKVTKVDHYLHVLLRMSRLRECVSASPKSLVLLVLILCQLHI